MANIRLLTLQGVCWNKSSWDSDLDWHKELEVDLKNNPADDITQVKTLLQLSQQNRWRQGPPFLQLNANWWPVSPCVLTESEPLEEVRIHVLWESDVRLHKTPQSEQTQELGWSNKGNKECASWGSRSQLKHTCQCYINSERHLLERSQSECFPEEFSALKTDKSVPNNSKLLPVPWILTWTWLNHSGRQTSQSRDPWSWLYPPNYIGSKISHNQTHY